MRGASLSLIGALLLGACSISTRVETRPGPWVGEPPDWPIVAATVPC